MKRIPCPGKGVRRGAVPFVRALVERRDSG
jgi:hypothetical protein